MNVKELQVKQKIVDAGYDGDDLDNRGSMYAALSLMIKQKPEEWDDLVYELRSVLSGLDDQDRHLELGLAKSEHLGIKACYECGMKPDDIPYLGQVLIVCMNHDDYAIVRSGSTLVDAISTWNDDSWIPKGITRFVYPL